MNFKYIDDINIFKSNEIIYSYKHIDYYSNSIYKIFINDINFLISYIKNNSLHKLNKVLTLYNINFDNYFFNFIKKNYFNSKKYVFLKNKKLIEYINKNKKIFIWPLSNINIKKYIYYKNGIIIYGNNGDDIICSCKGTVIYVNNNLYNKKNILIIKHDNNYISIYINYNKFFVKKNDIIFCGEKISKISNLCKFYFEIVYNKKSLDPLKYFKNV